jgi:hypothetical protein
LCGIHNILLRTERLTIKPRGIYATTPTGMISFEIYGQVIPFRPFSPRALAVHQPREACIARGFSPTF